MKASNHRILRRLLLVQLLMFPVLTLAQQSCASLRSLDMPGITITSARAIQPPWQLPEQGGFLATTRSQSVMVAFCRVEGFATPTDDSHIGFEVWLPDAADWNGRYLAVGNPGFIGSIALGGLARVVEQGYVTASTDTGHVDEGFEWAIGHPEKWADWGHRAVHETAVVTKTLARQYYGRPVRYSYWNSCHNGGNQGLNEVQRYPDDFDGVVAGDPAYYISRLQSGTLYISWVSLKDGMDAPGYIPPEKYPVIHRAVLDQCDHLDGLVDGILEDPRQCPFEPASIRCHSPDGAACLTDEQVETARKIYAGARFADGAPIFTGMEPGSELQWRLLNAGPEPFWVNVAYFKGMVFEDPDWDFRSFDVDRDTRLAEAKTGAAVDASSADLKAFKDRGGKLIMYMAWNETGMPPRQLTHYYERVQAELGGAEQTRNFARLFMVPASAGCPGFRNAEDFNTLQAVQRWVEEGIAPDTITYAHRHEGKIYRTRPVCAYPAVARYLGTGDPNEAASFSCSLPD